MQQVNHTVPAQSVVTQMQTQLCNVIERSHDAVWMLPRCGLRVCEKSEDPLSQAEKDKLQHAKKKRNKDKRPEIKKNVQLFQPKDQNPPLVPKQYADDVLHLIDTLKANSSRLPKEGDAGRQEQVEKYLLEGDELLKELAEVRKELAIHLEMSKKEVAESQTDALQAMRKFESAQIDADIEDLDSE